MVSACVRASLGLTEAIVTMLRTAFRGPPIACTYRGADVMISDITLRQLATAFERGSIVATDDPSEGLVGAYAAYVNPLNLLYVSSDLDLGQQEGRSAVLHECVHALQDASHFPLHSAADLRVLENFAYIVQAVGDARAGVPLPQLLGRHQQRHGDPLRTYADRIVDVVVKYGLHRGRAKFFSAEELSEVPLPSSYDAPNPAIGASLSRRLEHYRRNPHQPGGIERAHVRACSVAPPRR